VNKKKTKQQHTNRPSSPAPAVHQETDNTAEPAFQVPPVAWLIGILLLTIVAYMPVFSAGFTNWDDLNYVVNNPYIALSGENFPRLFTENVLGNIHPLTMFSLGVDHFWVGTESALPYHLTNLLLHLLNTALTYFLALRLSNNRQMVALITALFFAIHPMHVESVAWVSARKDVLYSAFFLGGLLLYIRFLNTQKWGWYALALLSMVLSCMSKPAAVVFPVILLLVDWYGERKLTDWKVWAEKVPFFITSLVAGWVTIGAQQEAYHKDYYSFGAKLVISAHNFVTYLTKAFVWGKLSAFHPYPENKTELPGSFYGSVAVFLLLTGLAIWSLRQRKTPFFGFAFYSVTIALVLKWVTVGSAIIAERYTYIPYIGVFFVVGSALYHYTEKSDTLRKIGLAAVGAFALACTVATWNQAKVWESGFTLFDQAVKNTPSNIAYLNRASQLVLAKQYDQALSDYNKADKLEPMYMLGIRGRGLLLLDMKRHADALRDFETLEKQNAADAPIFMKKGGCLVHLQRFDEAIQNFNKAIELDSAYGIAYHDRAAAYFHQKNYPQAYADYTRALELNEPKATALTNRGAVQLMTADYAGALRDFDQAIENGADTGQMHYFRSAALDKLGRKPEAFEAAEKARQKGYALPPGYLERLSR
jgi:protein O-mannosyl-transferase